MLLQNGAPLKLGTFQVDVGAKLFHPHTGSLYDIALDEKVPFQTNSSSKYRRDIVRVVLDKEAGALEERLRQQHQQLAAEYEQAEGRLATELAKQARLVREAEVLKLKAAELASGLNNISGQLSFRLPNGETIGEAAIPFHWEDMGTKMYAEVPLDPDSEEFRKIKAYFHRGPI